MELTDLCKQELLATTGRRIYNKFLNLEERLETFKTAKPFQEQLTNEFQRFSLWAANLGLYHTGHSSLDYRFRDAPSVADFAKRLLKDLEKNLSIIQDELGSGLESTKSPQSILSASYSHIISKNTTHSSRLNFRHRSNSRLSDSRIDTETSDDEESEDEESFDSFQTSRLDQIALESIGGTIDRLYRLSFRIRNPSTRTGFSKAREYRQVDEETNIDLIDQFREQDLRHVQEVTRNYQSHLSDNHSYQYLIHRLAEANTRRRQQFRHWKRHKEKLERAQSNVQRTVASQKSRQTSIHQNELLELPQANQANPSVPSSASRVLDFNADNDDTLSAISTSTYALLTREPDRAELLIPQLPPKLQERKAFECPYCFTLCSSRASGKQAWEIHVLRDLRPYVCIFERCPEANQQYDSYKEWVGHEIKCLGRLSDVSEPNPSTESSSFVEEALIPKLGAAKQSSEELTQRPGPTPASVDMPFTPSTIDQCPICLQPQATFNHVGLHLQRIAIFALPRSTGLEEDEETRSANGASVDSNPPNVGSGVDALSTFSNLEDLTPQPGFDKATTLTADALSSLDQDASRFNEMRMNALFRNSLNVSKVPVNKGRNPLHAAVRIDDIAAVRSLLAGGANVNARDSKNVTVLQLAAVLGNEDIVRLLLDMGANPNGNLVSAATNSDTPLHDAVRFARMKIVRLLLDNGAEVNARAEHGGTALQSAAALENEEIVRLLLEKGASPNGITTSSSVNCDTPLHVAARTGNFTIVSLMLETGADIQARDKNGDTPLDIAISKKDEDILRLLLQQGGDINTPLQAAILREDEDKVRWLLLQGEVDVNAKDEESGFSALQVAVLRANMAIILLLLEKGADVDGNVLNIAILEEKETVIRLLLDNGADPNTMTPDGNTVLMGAVSRGKRAIIQLLLHAGADINARSASGVTVLQAAVSSSTEVIIRILLHAGADVHVRDANGTTVLQLAVSRGKNTVIQLLLDAGVDVNAADSSHSTALHIAVMGRNEKSVQLLLDKGADVKAKSDLFGTPLQAATNSKPYREAIVQLLKERGAV